MREENGRLRSQIEQERSERLRAAQEEMIVNMTECEEVINDVVAEAMNWRVEEEIKSIDVSNWEWERNESSGF